MVTDSRIRLLDYEDLENQQLLIQFFIPGHLIRVPKTRHVVCGAESVATNFVHFCVTLINRKVVDGAQRDAATVHTERAAAPPTVHPTRSRANRKIGAKMRNCQNA